MRFVAVFALLLTTLSLQESAGADVGDSLVYLLPDRTGRYRPILDAGGSLRVLADIDAITAPVMSPDGSRVAFAGAVGDESLGRYGIFIVNANGSALRQLTPGSLAEMDPSWSPNGAIIVVSQNQTGSLTRSSCCRLALVDVGTGQITGLTGNIGALRPSYSPQGSFIVYDTPAGVWRIPPGGGTASLVVSGGFDAVVSPDESRVAYAVRNGSSMEIRTIEASGGSATTVLSTSGKIENPQWRGDRIYFLEYNGDGYDGRSGVALRSVRALGGDLRTHRSFGQLVVAAGLGLDNDEMFFYRDDGLFRYYAVRPDGSLPSPLLEGDRYTTGWSSITSIDLDGDGQDEMFFYREDGLFRYYHIRPDASLPGPLLAGEGYTTNWSSITSVDLDGDGQDEMFFYRGDGLFRYYHIRADGSLPKPLVEGDGYSTGWDAITAVDLDGDSQDEMFFYRDDGLFRYYNIRSDGQLGIPIRGGSDYPPGWTSISSIDLDGDGQDEMFFYRDDGQFAFYEVDADGSLGPAIVEGDGYTTGWDVIRSIALGPG